MAGLSLVTPPAVEPVTLAEARAFLKNEEVSADDTLVTDLIAAARKASEEWLGRAFVNQEWDYFLDAFPVNSSWYPEAIELPMAPLVSVTSVKYTPDVGSTLTVTSTDYFVDTSIHGEPPRIMPHISKTWPGDTLRVLNGVEVRFVAGYGAAAANVPEHIRLGVKQLVDFWYTDRDAVGLMPDGVKETLAGVRGAFAWA